MSPHHQTYHRRSFLRDTTFRPSLQNRYIHCCRQPMYGYLPAGLPSDLSIYLFWQILSTIPTMPYNPPLSIHHQNQRPHNLKLHRNLPSKILLYENISTHIFSSPSGFPDLHPSLSDKNMYLLCFRNSMFPYTDNHLYM